MTTGEIMCALHDRVLDEYKKQLQVGAVLVLRQVSGEWTLCELVNLLTRQYNII